MSNQYADDHNQDDFSLEYSGSDQQRELKNGVYDVEIKSVKKNVQQVGKYKGEQQLEWTMTIIGSELSKLNFIITSLLGPSNMAWTTDRIIKAVFPAIQKGQVPQISEFLGKKLRVGLKTRVNEKNGKTSMYCETTSCEPYVEPGSAGALGDMGSFGPDTTESDVP